MTGNTKLVLLEPRYDRAQSFYKKAHLAIKTDEIDLISYATHICNYNETTKTLRFERSFQNSNTTRRHVREFMHFVEDQCGARGLMGACGQISKAHKIRSFRQFCDDVEYIDLARNVVKMFNEEYSVGI